MEDVHSLLTNIPPPSGDERKITFEMISFVYQYLVHNYYTTNFILKVLLVLHSIMFYAAPRLKAHSLKYFH